MTGSSEREEIHDLIVETFRADLGGEASVPQVVDAVDAKLTDWMGDYGRRKWLATAVGQALRTKSSAGLPVALSSGGGRYVAIELCLADDFVGAARIRLNQADGQTAEARRLLDECYRVHGVRVTLADLRTGRVA